MISGEEAGRSKTWQREQWLPVLELSIREVFEVMLGSELESAPGDRSPQALEVTAMVGLAGSLCGVVTFRCGFETATRLASIMLAREISDSDEQAGDAVGEVCNILAGNFKSKLLGLADRCVLSAPTVVTGANYSVHSLAAQRLEKVFLFEGRPVSVALELRM